MYGLQENPAVQISLVTPSECYRQLTQGEADVGLIPVIGLQQNSKIRALKGLGIAAVQRTESIYLFSTKPLDRLATVTTDPASLTSVALLKIILKKKYQNSPEFRSGDISNIHNVLKTSDAVLVIGDEAILAEKTDYDHYDLATEWYSITRLPFIFAVWACSRQLSQEEEGWLRQCYELATSHWEEIIQQARILVDVDEEFLKRYYKMNLHYRLTKQDYEGLIKFLSLAAECGIIETIRKDIWA